MFPSAKAWLRVIACLILVKPLFSARIGLFFGNFDPVHLAHTTIIDKSIKSLNLDRFYAIPFMVSDSDSPLSFASRCEMLKIASLRVQGNLQVPCEKIMSWDQENPLSPDPDSFTERVLKEIFHLEGWDHQYYQILGSDEFQHLLKKRGFPTKDKPLSIVVIKRPGFNQTIPRHLIPELGERLFPIDFDTPRVSSREIRALLKKGEISPYLSDEVLKYIKAKQLYGLEESISKQENKL